MSRNVIQFQKGLSLPKFLEKYGSEAACREALAKLRWPESFRCPEGGIDTGCPLKAPQLIHCHPSLRSSDGAYSPNAFREHQIALEHLVSGHFGAYARQVRNLDHGAGPTLSVMAEVHT